ncbi:hypothetical protein DFJ74DRAFT_418916 [Hyaloraphidium curvatum]|nr:hypothetical protein DFJ74DRAFT_418916 [Hyaloraphidium curvatum]
MVVLKEVGLFPSRLAALQAILWGNFYPGPIRGHIVQSWIAELALLPAWARCVQKSTDKSGDRSMLDHVDSEPECTCAGARCSWLANDFTCLLLAIRRNLSDVLNCRLPPLLDVDTAFRAPAGVVQRMEYHPRSALPCECCAALTGTLLLPPPAFALIRLEGRVRRRLMRRALVVFLDRARMAVRHGKPFETAEEIWGFAEEPYMQLHAEMRQRWSHDFAYYNIPFLDPVFIAFLVTLMTSSIVNHRELRSSLDVG